MVISIYYNITFYFCLFTLVTQTNISVTYLLIFPPPSNIKQYFYIVFETPLLV
jgi:hypothetical protein